MCAHVKVHGGNGTHNELSALASDYEVLAFESARLAKEHQELLTFENRLLNRKSSKNAEIFQNSKYSSGVLDALSALSEATLDAPVEQLVSADPSLTEQMTARTTPQTEAYAIQRPRKSRTRSEPPQNSEKKAGALCRLQLRSLDDMFVVPSFDVESTFADSNNSSEPSSGDEGWVPVSRQNSGISTKQELLALERDYDALASENARMAHDHKELLALENSLPKKVSKKTCTRRRAPRLEELLAFGEKTHSVLAKASKKKIDSDDSTSVRSGLNTESTSAGSDLTKPCSGGESQNLSQKCRQALLLRDGRQNPQSGSVQPGGQRRCLAVSTRLK